MVAVAVVIELASATHHVTEFWTLWSLPVIQRYYQTRWYDTYRKSNWKEACSTLGRRRRTRVGTLLGTKGSSHQGWSKLCEEAFHWCCLALEGQLHGEVRWWEDCQRLPYEVGECMCYFLSMRHLRYYWWNITAEGGLLCSPEYQEHIRTFLVWY